MLIKGEKLNEEQRKIVLAAFVRRWTFERAEALGYCPACKQQEEGGGALQIGEMHWHDYHMKLVSDDEWIRAHAFHFVRNGSRLAENCKHAEPAYMAD
jgi:hypothetical protein